MLVAWLTSLTVEPGTAAPFGSVMVPLTPPVDVWAEAARPSATRQKSSDAIALKNFMANTSPSVERLQSRAPSARMEPAATESAAAARVAEVKALEGTCPRLGPGQATTGAGLNQTGVLSLN